jgi:pyruvate/2-oxoglutarate/acetoin dehydrogenase E1 component
MATQVGSRRSDVGAQEFTYLQAIHQAQLEEMRRDPTTIIMGEGIRGGVYGGGFIEEFGPERVLETPISENGFVGAAVGAAMTGLRPIVDVTIATFLYCAVDELISQAAKNRYMFGGQADIPVTYRAVLFYSGNNAAHHSDRPYPMFMNIPGLKIVVPSTPADMKGLLKTAIRENDPVIVFEDTALWAKRGLIPDGEHLVPLGVAAVPREGTDVTLVAIGAAVPEALLAAEQVAGEGVSVEVIDPRSLVPMDWEAIIQSVEKTGRLVVADLANRTCSAASEIAATVGENCFSALTSPIIRVTTPDTHIPFSPALMGGLFPNCERIVDAVRRVLAK